MFGTLRAVWAEMGEGKCISEKKGGGGVLALIISAIQQMLRVEMTSDLRTIAE